MAKIFVPTKGRQLPGNPEQIAPMAVGQKQLGQGCLVPARQLRPKAPTHCAAVCSAEGASFSNITALPPVFGILFYARI
jgi:hypothetical protein